MLEIMKREVNQSGSSGNFNDESSICKMTLRNLVCAPTMPLTCLHLTTLLSSTMVDRIMVSKMGEKSDSAVELSTNNYYDMLLDVKKIQLKAALYEEYRKTGREFISKSSSAYTAQTRSKDLSTAEGGNSGELFSSGDLTYHLDYMMMALPAYAYTPANIFQPSGNSNSSCSLHRIFLLSSSNNEISCNANSDVLCEAYEYMPSLLKRFYSLYVRYQLSASLMLLINNGVSAGINCIDNGRIYCPLKEFICSSVSTSLCPEYFSDKRSALNFSISSNAASSATYRSYAPSLLTPLNFALAFSHDASMITEQYLALYFDPDSDSTDNENDEETMKNLAGSIFGMCGTDSNFIQKLLQFASYYNRRDSLKTILSQFYHVEDHADKILSTIWPAAEHGARLKSTLVNIGFALSGYFEPYHRVCSLIEIAVSTNALSVLVFYYCD